MCIVSRIQISSESRHSLADAVSEGMRSVVSSIGDFRGRSIHVEQVRQEASRPGQYCVSLRVAVEIAPVVS